MRQQPSGRRPRGRSNRKHYVPHRSQNYDSHGPDVRVRGNAMQVYEKYVNLARDATSSGDRIAAESYQQYAEHYFRIINDTTDPQRPTPERANAERPDAQQGAAELSGAARPGAERSRADRRKPGRQPYPTDAEQPFVEGGAKAAAGGNGQAPETRPASAESSVDSPAESPGESPAGAAQAPVVDGDGTAAPAPEAKAKPRSRGRPRTRAKAGNGAAASDRADGADGADGKAGAAKRQPSEAGEPSS